MTLYGFLLRRLVTSFLLACAGLFFVFLPPMVLTAVTRLSGVGLAAVAGYLPLLLSESGPYLLPLAFLLASIMTFAGLKEDGEWTAIVLAGHHPAKALLPGAAFALLLVGGSFYFLDEVGPGLRFRQQNYRRSVQVEVLSTLFPGKTSFHLGEFSLQAAERRGDTLFDVVATVPPGAIGAAGLLLADEVELSMTADSLLMNFRKLQIPGSLTEIGIGALRVTLPLSVLLGEKSPPKLRVKYLASSVVLSRLASGDVPLEERRQYRCEVYRRRAQALTFLAFFLLGAPTGLRLGRKGLMSSLPATAGYALVFYVLSIRFGEQLASSSDAWVLPGIFGANLIGGGIGAALILREVRR